MLAAAIIVFREVVEAGLIVGIVLAATQGVPAKGALYCWWHCGWHFRSIAARHVRR